MIAGKLRHKVTIQKPVRVKDLYAGADITWTNVDEIRVGIETMTDRERFFAQQISPQLVHKVTMRYRADILKSWRLLFGTRILKIIGMRNIRQRNREIELTCEEEPG